MTCVKMIVSAAAAFSMTVAADLLKELEAADALVDAGIAAIATREELSAKQNAWRTAWLKGIGGFPTERTPLNAKTTGTVPVEFRVPSSSPGSKNAGTVPVFSCGAIIENIIFESLPGVYVTAHLALPAGAAFKAPHPAALMAMGHSNVGLLAPRYAAQMKQLVEAGFAVFTWDPPGQGERVQCLPEFGKKENCSFEHTSLGARGWLVGENIQRYFLWEAMRAIDYLETRADLDLSRLAITGNSGGGTMSAITQALEPRIKVAFPNCYVSSLRETFNLRGCHDAEQFFFNQLGAGVNHAAILSLGQPRVALTVGSRYADYFPHKGSVETFKVFSGMCGRLGFKGPYWHFHCEGPHGLPPPARAAVVDWMKYCVKGGPAPKAVEEYHKLGGTDGRYGADPVQTGAEPYPFPKDKLFCTPERDVRKLAGFKSYYSIFADRADKLAEARKVRGELTRDEKREIVRRRAAIRPLDRLLRETGGKASKPFDHPRFDWWYLDGPYGRRRENEAALMAALGRSVVGRDAENIILKAHAAGAPQVLKAKGWDCIAAAHAYAAEPQLFSGIEFENPPPSWSDMVRDPDTTNDSYAVAVWGALEEYDWVDLR